MFKIRFPRLVIVPTGILLVGSAQKAKSSGSVASIGVNINVTAGNRIIAIAMCEGSKIGTVSGSSSGAFTADKTLNDVAGVGIFSKIAASTGVETVTFTPSSSGLISIIAAEFSGIATSSYLDATTRQGADISDTATTSASLTPATNNCLVIAAVSLGTLSSRTFSLPSGFALLEEVENDGNTGQGEADYLIQSTAASVQPSWTLSAGAWWACVTAAYKPA